MRPDRLRLWRRGGLLWLCAALLPSCGYRLMGPPRGLLRCQPVAVLAFTEAPSLGLSAPLAAHLSRLLAADGVRLTARRAAATAILGGDIVVSTSPTASRAGITAYQISAAISAQLTAADGSIAWRTSLAASEDFLPDVGVDLQPLTTERQRRFAVARLAERAALRLHEAMVVALQAVP